MDELIIYGQRVEIPLNLDILTFEDDGLHRFVNKERSLELNVTEIILHETVTTSWERTVQVLKQQKLGVHLIVDADGTVYQHGDLATDFLWHASEHNAWSIGIECVNPYEPRFAPRNGPWTETIDAPWAGGQAKGKYVVPTAAQCESVAMLTKWLTDGVPEGLELAIPQRWPGLQKTQRLALGRILGGALPHPGVLAHCNFGHADGTFQVLYSWLRIEPGLSPKEAYADTKRLLTGARGFVDLDDYFVQNPYIEAV